MKIFLVLYVGTGVGGTWGPLPYDMAECERRAAERNEMFATIHTSGMTPNGAELTEAQRQAVKTWRMACVSGARPVIGDPA